MTQPLSRKTKGEILAEYKKLQDELVQARQTAAQVHEPRSQAILAKTEKQTEGDILEAVQKLRATFTGSLNQLVEASMVEVNRLQELREAVAMWQKNLEHFKNVTVAAETIDSLLAEHELKKRQFAADEERRHFELETKLGERERQWQQAQEEKEYETTRKRKQAEEEFSEKMRKREKDLTERATEISQREAEVKSWQQQVQEFSTKLEEELAKKELDVTNRLKAEYEAVIRQLKQEADGDKKVSDLQISNLHEHNSRQQDEIISLKRALEEANKRAQDLAARVIEGNRPIQVVTKEEKSE